MLLTITLTSIYLPTRITCSTKQCPQYILMITLHIAWLLAVFSASFTINIVTPISVTCTKLHIIYQLICVQ